MAVLVVDDEPCFRYTLKALLRKEGFEVIEADGGIDGYDIVREMGPSIDLLLTDINMPRMGGLKLAKLARELHPHMPILLMTADVAFTRTPQVNFEVLIKPFRRQYLLQTIQKLLGRQRTATPSQVQMCGAKVA
jgi:CheY-like chemotaxis protein